MVRPRNQSKLKQLSVKSGKITWVHQPISTIGRRNLPVENLARRAKNLNDRAIAEMLLKSQRGRVQSSVGKPGKPVAKRGRKR